MAFALGACLARFAFAHGFFGLQMDSVRAVDQAVHDRVRQRGIARCSRASRSTGSWLVTMHARVPTRSSSSSNRSLRSRGADGSDRKVIDDEHADLGDGGEALAEAAVGMAEVELLEQARRAHVPGAQALAAGLMRQGARQVRLAAAGRAWIKMLWLARIQSQEARLASCERSRPPRER